MLDVDADGSPLGVKIDDHAVDDFLGVCAWFGVEVDGEEIGFGVGKESNRIAARYSVGLERG